MLQFSASRGIFLIFFTWFNQVIRLAYKKKHKKEIPKKVYDIAVKLIKGDVVITDIKEKDTKLYYDAVDFIDKSDSEKYVKRFEDGASEVRKKIKK